MWAEANEPMQVSEDNCFVVRGKICRDLTMLILRLAYWIGDRPRKPRFRGICSCWECWTRHCGFDAETVDKKDPAACISEHWGCVWWCWDITALRVCQHLCFEPDGFVRKHHPRSRRWHLGDPVAHHLHYHAHPPPQVLLHCSQSQRRRTRWAKIFTETSITVSPCWRQTAGQLFHHYSCRSKNTSNFATLGWREEFSDPSVLGIDKIVNFKVNFGVKSTINSNLQAAHYFRAFMLDEWEVRSYVIIPSIPSGQFRFCHHLLGLPFKAYSTSSFHLHNIITMRYRDDGLVRPIEPHPKALPWNINLKFCAVAAFQV